MQTETSKSTLPAYVPFQTFINFFSKLEQGVPNRIDRSFLSKSYSGTIGSQLITSLRFLGLVEGDDNKTTAELERLAQEQSTRKQLLAELLRKRYQPIFTDVGDLAKATHMQLEQAFKQNYSIDGDTRRKAISFFVHLAQYAEVPLSAYIRTTSNSGTNRTTPRTSPRKAKGRQNGTRPTKQRTAAKSTRDAVKPSDHAGNANSKTKTVTLLSGGKVTLTYSVDLFDMDEQDRQFLFGLIDQLRDYEQGLSDDSDEDEEEYEEDEEE